MVLFCALVAVVLFFFLISFVTIFTRGEYRIRKLLTDKVYLITGSSAGCGKYTALELAAHGAEVYMACRNLPKAEKVAKEIKEITGNNKVHVILLNLCDLQSVRKCAEEFLKRSKRLDVLINNAGTGYDGPERKQTADGLDEIMAANYYGHFLLTYLLLDVLKATTPSRIVNVSSAAHWFTKFNSDDDFNVAQGSYRRGFRAYCQSKLAMNMFTKSLSKELQGTGVTVNSLHPGYVASELFREAPLYVQAVHKFTQLMQIAKTSEQGSYCTLYVATSPDVETVSGKYFSDCQPGWESPRVKDRRIAEKLIQRSKKLVGLAEANNS